MDVATRVTLANLAGSFLLLVGFVLLAVAAVVGYMLWRGVRLASPEMRRLIRELEVQALRTEGLTKDTARAIIVPQLNVVSRWVELKTTAAVLVGRRPGRDDPPAS